MKDMELKYRTRRWNSTTTLTLRKLNKGWHIAATAINGETDKEGAPILESNLHQDNVKFPHDVGAFLGFVWDQLENGVIDEDAGQQMIDQIGAWISSCETSQPIWREWNAGVHD